MLDLDPIDLPPDFQIHELPEIHPTFSVPPLEEKPQNPILDTLKLVEANRSVPNIAARLPRELVTLSLDSEVVRGVSPRSSQLDSRLWQDVLSAQAEPRNRILSWDRLRSPFRHPASSTAFLSEQDDYVFAAARYHVLPQLSDPERIMVYVSQDELLTSLKMTLLGTSSIFHVWDDDLEKFVQRAVQPGKLGYLLIDGKDETISESLISRFLTIGTLLRRVELFLKMLRERSAKDGPTVHAYAHTLSSIVSYLRLSLARSPPTKENIQEEAIALTSIWIHYGIYEGVLTALSQLCGRDLDRLPHSYDAFDSAPVPLLSRIYDTLDLHIERRSQRTIIAIFAFILTNTSYEYLQEISRSIGYTIDLRRKMSHVVGEKPAQYFDEGDEEDKENEIFEAIENLDQTFPDFFPPHLLDILPAAQKSLILLREADPDHHLLNPATERTLIRWFWTKNDIDSAWKGQYTMPKVTDTSSKLQHPQSDAPCDIDDAFAAFKLFDLEPGQNLGKSKQSGAEHLRLQTFIDSFPDALPTVTPTLSHLTSLVLTPLINHAAKLSKTLLSVFLSSSVNLNFRAHLLLLRSYLLVTAPPFRSRLSAALFSDSDEYDLDKPTRTSLWSLRRNKTLKTAGEGKQPWAIGLAPALLERETWPPVGADLSFFLRTVIVDSFENAQSILGEESGNHTVLEEAEYRLGFAVRDLPTGPGRDKWLSPLTIEALDFLYMDYKPPRPLEILITPDILSKYQRMFAFIIRLMRVEHSLIALFRMTKSSDRPLFPTLTAARKQFLHFRFVAHRFVSSLSEYVFNTAIGGNFDPFIMRLSTEAPPVLYDGSLSSFPDVFALGASHSKLLDDVLSACLLRSGQKSVGELLRSSLELILDYAVVVAELYRGRLEEYRAALELDSISKKFRTKMATLAKVLKSLAEKNIPTFSVPSQTLLPSEDSLRKPSGGTDALYHLLIRLDLADWWSSQGS